MLQPQHDHTRRRCMQALLCLLVPIRAQPAAVTPECRAWPLWRDFVAHHVQADGRVIDDQHGSIYTTSEGQAYALFFALVNNQRERFETLLAWTDRHLAAGALGESLPGWRWGRHADGRWSLIDANAASDADLWLAHTLFESARLWKEPRHAAVARRLVATIRREEVVDVPGFGPMLLPGPRGFRDADGSVRLNPSYYALHQLRGLARRDATGPWQRMAQGLPAMLRAAAPHGVAPDWLRLHPQRGWQPDDATGAIASYDAIRTVLWAGVASSSDPLRQAVLDALSGWPDAVVDGEPLPERVDTRTGQRSGHAPSGFDAALLPALVARGQRHDARRLAARLRAQAEPLQADRRDAACRSTWHVPGRLGPNSSYYDQVLGLFGLGAVEGRYAFDRQGRLLVPWA